MPESNPSTKNTGGEKDSMPPAWDYLEVRKQLDRIEDRIKNQVAEIEERLGKRFDIVEKDLKGISKKVWMILGGAAVILAMLGLLRFALPNIELKPDIHIQLPPGSIHISPPTPDK